MGTDAAALHQLETPSPPNPGPLWLGDLPLILQGLPGGLSEPQTTVWVRTSEAGPAKCQEKKVKLKLRKVEIVYLPAKSVTKIRAET